MQTTRSLAAQGRPEGSIDVLRHPKEAAAKVCRTVPLCPMTIDAGAALYRRYCRNSPPRSIGPGWIRSPRPPRCVVQVVGIRPPIIQTTRIRDTRSGPSTGLEKYGECGECRIQESRSDLLLCFQSVW